MGEILRGLFRSENGYRAKRDWLKFLLNSITLLALISGLSSGPAAPLHAGVRPVKAAGAIRPVVAIHVSELTQALENMPAVAPTPTGSGYSGYQWFYTSWHYFVIYESLKTALDSDGTPYQIVTDADIASGALMDAGRPRYPIVFSLAAEAVDDNEIQPLRSYVNAGGFLFVGSSSFTRNPNGTSRGDFALANEMGLDMVTHSLENWVLSAWFTHQTNHRLVAHIPTGDVIWDMLTSWDDITWGTSGSQQIWKVILSGAEGLATADGNPVLATKKYGAGQFIYHAAFNPIVGAGGLDAGMYSYTIYRNAIEWAFENANLPVVKRSPWPYAYDAALMVRHDFESDPNAPSRIESSAQYEKSVGVKGEYYFCTGAVRTLDAAALQQGIASLRRAVSSYGATIGSHNGGYPNPDVSDPNEYQYWHWGPDTMLDHTSFGPSYPSYTNGYDYSKDSALRSFEDLESWLAGTDNGRTGCGAAGNCPRLWAGPFFNSGRDRSARMMEELGVSTMGEQKISPFPHWTLSYDPSNPDHRYNHLSLPTSDWYVGYRVSQSIEGHDTASIQALVDYYYQKGYLINLYGHSSSASGSMKTYIDYAISKPNVWPTNAAELYDWWVKRDSLVVAPSYSETGSTAVVTAAIHGSTDPQAAVELVLPNWSSGLVGNIQVWLNGAVASTSEYRMTNYGVKVRVGVSVNSVEVRYKPLQTWKQTDWMGGAGQSTWSDPTRYASASGTGSSSGQLQLNVASPGNTLFTDSFNQSDPTALAPWTVVSGSWAINNHMLRGTATAGGGNAHIYYQPGAPSSWTNYSVQSRLLFPPGAFGGGLFGRLNPATGSRYAAWVYPSRNTIKLLKWSDWNNWQPLDEKPLSASGWNTMKMSFSGSRIQVYWNDRLVIDVDDTTSPCLSGSIGIDTFPLGGDYLVDVDDVVVRALDQYSSDGVLLSSAYDGQVNAQWFTLGWDAFTPRSTSVCLRTRSADQVDQLAAAPWSACQPAGIGNLAGLNRRWMQYQVQLHTDDTSVTPLFYENRILYSPGANLAPSSLTYGSTVSGESGSSVSLSATLLDENHSPIAGRTVYFTLDSLTAVSGLTNASGTASVSLPLNLAAGNYPLTAAFYGDATYAPAYASITYSVTPHINRHPVAVDDSYTINVTTSLSIAAPGVLGNDTDVEGGSLTAERLTGPTHGNLVLQADGSFIYTPACGYLGSDSFTYRASDGVDVSNSANVYIQIDHSCTTRPLPSHFHGSVKINGQNAPDGTQVQALINNVVYATTLTQTSQGSSVYSIDVPSDDVDTAGVIEGGKAGDVIRFRVMGLTAGQTGTWSGGTDVVLNLTAVNPVCLAIAVIADQYTATEDGEIHVLAGGVLENDSDSCQLPLTTEVSTGPSHGTLTLNADGSFIYRPDANFNGQDSFTYAAHNGLTSSTAVVQITVYPVNDRPTASGGTLTTGENQPLAIHLGDLAADLETSDLNLDYQIDSAPQHGILTRNGMVWVYTPASNFTGRDTFQYHVRDTGDPNACSGLEPACSAGMTSALATITIDVQGNPATHHDTYTYLPVILH